MKTILSASLSLCLILASFQRAATTDHEEKSIPLGEQLDYNAHFGWFNAGVVTLKIDTAMHEINQALCYKIDLHAQTKGLLHLLKIKVKDQWRTYIDAQYRPHRFYRYIQEGKYTKNESIHFDYTKHLAVVSQLDAHTKEPLQTTAFNIPEQVHDFISVWYYLRTLDFNQWPVGTTRAVNFFFDEVLYENAEIRFLGREILKTKWGSLPTLVVSPVLPTKAHSVLLGKDAIELFLSDDEQKIPIKAKVKLLVGSFELELNRYKNLTHPLLVR